jgi:hypothetical protein
MHKEVKFRAEYSPLDTIKVKETSQEGTVVRLSSAGDIEYIHVLLQNTLTPVTFRDFQIEHCRPNK